VGGEKDVLLELVTLLCMQYVYETLNSMRLEAYGILCSSFVQSLVRRTPKSEKCGVVHAYC
jgi:hypothetical protein